MLKILQQLKDGETILASVVDIFIKSGLERFDYKLGDKYRLTIYKVNSIIRLDISKVDEDTKK